VTNFALITDDHILLETGGSKWEPGSGMRKCSYFIRTASGGSPGFKLYDVEAGVSTAYMPTGKRLYLFDLHYIEFMDSEVAMLPGTAWLGTTIAENTYPMITSPDNAGINTMNRAPTDFYAGEEDIFIDYQLADGSTYTEHKHVIEARYNRYEELYADYADTVAMYDASAENYNSIIQDYNDQVAEIEVDAFAAWAAGTVATLGDLPDVPCPPTRPPAYSGVYLSPDANGFAGVFATEGTWNN
jgi:hypothetical protein